VESTEESIVKFLMDFKKIMTTNGLWLVDRIQRNKSVVELGLNKKAVESEILSLLVFNYCSGPEPDEDLSRPGMIWEFGKKLVDVKYT
jgi:hypothetical protein